MIPKMNKATATMRKISRRPLQLQMKWALREPNMLQKLIEPYNKQISLLKVYEKEGTRGVRFRDYMFSL
jgi:hypothetical protein